MSGTLTLPDSEFAILADKLKSIGFQNQCGFLSSNETCESLHKLMGKLTIRLDQYLFWIPPEAYTYTDTNKYGTCCYANIIGWDRNYYVMGDLFLYSYFITFNYAHNTVEFRSKPDV